MQDHVDEYHEFSANTKIFFSIALAIWDADFYVKVDDDVHVNLGAYLFLRHCNLLLKVYDSVLFIDVCI